MNPAKQFQSLKRESKRWADVVDSDMWETVKIYALAQYSAQLQMTNLIDNNARIEGAKQMLEVLGSLCSPEPPRREMKALKPV